MFATIGSNIRYYRQSCDGRCIKSIIFDADETAGVGCEQFLTTRRHTYLRVKAYAPLLPNVVLRDIRLPHKRCTLTNP